MRSFRRLAGVCAVALGSGIGLFGAFQPARADSASEAASFVGLINALRSGHGLRPLSVDGRLTAVATAWSATMAATNNLLHNPNLGSAIPPPWLALGENVGVGPAGNVSLLQAAFVASPHHYANMVDPRFTSIGVGVVESAGQMWVTEDFEAAAGAPAPPPPPPPPAAPAPRVAPPALAPAPASPAHAPAGPTARAVPAAAPAGPAAGAAAVAATTPAIDPSVTLVLERLQSLDRNA